MSSSPFAYSCQTVTILVKLGTTLLIGPACGKLSHIFSSAMFNSETVLGFGQRFQNSFVRRSLDTISDSVHIWRVSMRPLLIFKQFTDSSRGGVDDDNDNDNDN